MCFTVFLTGSAYVAEKFKKVERKLSSVVTDPFIFLSGGIAGAAGRLAALPFDHGGVKGSMNAVYRRAPQFGLLMWFYVPTASTTLPQVYDPVQKMTTTFLIGAFSGFFMRAICNPVNRTRDEAIRLNTNFLSAANYLRKKTVLQFYYTTPNLFANALYFGALMTCFEGLRRFMERNGVPQETNLQVVMTNTVAAAGAATVASCVTYPYSAHRYLQTVIHDSAICRGLGATLLKEIPMMAVSFGVFSVLTPIVSPKHSKYAGFGY
jgi:hypothetical protein